MRGSVDRVRQDKGFCFVKPFDEGEDHFLHFSDILNAEGDMVREGVVVEFESTKGPKGLRAVQARLMIDGLDAHAPKHAREFEQLFNEFETDVVDVPGPRGKLR